MLGGRAATWAETGSGETAVAQGVGGGSADHSASSGMLQEASPPAKTVGALGEGDGVWAGEMGQTWVWLVGAASRLCWAGMGEPEGGSNLWGSVGERELLRERRAIWAQRVRRQGQVLGEGSGGGLSQVSKGGCGR